MEASRVLDQPFSRFSLLGAMVATLLLVSGCERAPLQPSDTQVRANLNMIRTWPGSPLPAGAARFRTLDTNLVPEFADPDEAVTTRATLPSRANGQTHIEDRKTGLGIDISLVGAKASAAQVVDGYVVYPRGHALGWVYQRAEPSGLEDYLVLDARPVSPSIAYQVKLGPRIAGLRLVENQLEMLDASGTPRLRLAPPYLVGKDGVRTDALLAVEGCAVDTDPAGPWGRAVKRSGPNSCRIIVSWANDRVNYPALLDPRWQTTGSLSVARQDHSLIYLPLTGKVLAVGGRSSPTSTTGLASAELFDNSSRTWSATTSMTGGRWSASATLLGASANGTTSQRVLIAGGINGTASVNTAQLYNQMTGTWSAAGTLNAPRHLHTATLLNDGRVLVCGGMNGTTILTSAALYNPASGSGSWAATTGPIPPPGWRSGTATLIKTSNNQLNNKVLLAGGNNGTGSISAVFLFDPAQSAFSTLASMPSPREGHQAVALSDGRILFAGGKNGSTTLASAVIFDPSWGPGSWNATGSMTTPRWGHAMNLLPSGVLTQGLVLVSGGSNGTSTLSTAEYWNGVNWATDGVMVAPVQQHASVALGQSLLVAGGAINNGSTTVSAAEVYDPSIGLGCRLGSQCASGFCVDGVCCDSACDGKCGSCNLPGHLGICTPVETGSVCRPAVGECDAAETCDGTNTNCPADNLQPATMECRPSAGECDLAESCTGASATCPADDFQADGTACDDGNACTSSDVCTAGACKGLDKTCDQPSEQCEESTCDLSDGECKRHTKQDGAACNDGNGCTQTDMCQAGQCTGGNEKECPASECFEAGTCTPETGECVNKPIIKMGCGINLTKPAVAKMDNGTYIAIFGYTSTAETPFHPSENTVTPPRTESPYPPAYLVKGTHLGAFLPSLNEGETITWTVDGQTESATANPDTALTPVTDGTGKYVDVGGTPVVIKPNLGPYLQKPDDPVGEDGPEPLPPGSKFLPTLPGQLSVGPTGAAVYTVPIKIPPGVSGMAPNLNLVYNSQSGYGIAGIGWNLTGLSIIHRCPKTLASDGYSQPITMDGTPVDDDDGDGDGVCLDGKRIFYRSDLKKFKAEMEDFTEIVYQDGFDRFVVTTKSGEKRLYGLFTKVQFPMEDADGIVKSDAGSPLVTAIWALDRVEDVWGNYYEFAYNEGDIGAFQDSGLLVTSIKYTGHYDGRIQTPGPFHLGFEYQARSPSEDDGDWPDTGRMRFRDSYLPNNKRLERIAIKRAGQTGELAHYTLGYHNTNGVGAGPRSRLEFIEYCVGDQCASSSFGWGTEAGDPSVVAWSDDQDGYHLPIDRMGPGTQLVDINGDGLVDLVQAVRGYGQSHVWRNTGAGWEPMDDWKLPGFISLGEPLNEDFSENWGNQAWRQMECVDPETSAPLPGLEDAPGCLFVLGFVGAEACKECLKNLADLDRDDLPDLTRSGTVFTDINGDGLPDLITVREPGPYGTRTGMHAAVYFNNTKSGSGPAWSPQPGLSGANLEQVLRSALGSSYFSMPLVEDPRDDGYSLADIDGDGRTEIVFTTSNCQNRRGCENQAIYVFRANLSTGRWERDLGSGPKGWNWTACPAGKFLLADINRDGLADIVGSSGTAWAINTGQVGKGTDGTMWRTRSIPDPAASALRLCFPVSQAGAREFVAATGDLDGDGMYDQVVRTWKESDDGKVIPDPPGFEATKVYTATGLGWNDKQGAGFRNGLLRFTRQDFSSDSRLLAVGPYQFQFTDLNADGRADAVVNYPWGGLFLLNTGVGFVDVEGHYAYSDFEEVRPVPTKLVPSNIKAAEPFDSFIDLNGDGIPDRIQLLRSNTDTSVYKGAWFNHYQRPVVRKFPNALADATIVDYVTITTQAGRAVSESEPLPVYFDADEKLDDTGTKYMFAPLNVVKSVVTDDGLGSKRTASYRYTNLRASSIGKGPVGFREVISSDDATGFETTTTYAQAYPYTGMAKKIERKDRYGKLTTKTETNYCYDLEAGTKHFCDPEGVWSGAPGEIGVFVHPSDVTDTTFLRDTGKENEDAPDSIVTVTEYVFDAHGNPHSTKVTTSSGGEKYAKTVVNEYGGDDSEEAVHGKPTSTTVTSKRLLPLEDDGTAPSRQQKTIFEYKTAELALSKKMVQPGTGFGTEVHTVYHYDTYGNLDITTVCASDFEKCEAGKENPLGDPQDPQHPPFRSSYVSFKVVDFQPGSTARTRSLGYRDGMYPVKATNALGHVQYTAYNDFLGVVVQSTGPNGIHTCFEYDGLGFKTAEVARCSETAPESELRTTITRYRSSQDTLTKTEPPTGMPSLVRSDRLGRTVETISYDFHGNLVHVDTEYDHQGRVAHVSKPHLTSVTGAQRSLTSTTYDWLGRVESVTDDLGSLDGGSTTSTGVIGTTYLGSSITTTQTVKGEARTRTEWKNALGKVSRIEDALGNQITYAYDPDGNLTDTKDPAGNIVHLDYDVLGRKTLSRDPDLGTWTYVYNGFGDLIEQTDAKNQEALLPTKMTYDQLGRMLTKTDPSGKTAEWLYDLGPKAKGKLYASISVADDRLAGDCPVPGTTEPKTGRAVRQLSYNKFGDLAQTRECIAGETYSTSYGYDSYGRQNLVTYPEINGTRFSLESFFSSTGFLHYLADGNDQNHSPYWVAKEMNPAGQVTKERTRNGVEVVSNRNSATGWLLGSKAIAKPWGDEVIQDLGFTFDEVGSLRTRTRGPSQVFPALNETFTYDKLDRLHTAEISIPSASGFGETQTFDYDNLGNISKKDGKTYTYTGCNAGPHAVCTVGGGSAYTYDANGNLTKGNGRSVDYDSANKPLHIESDVATGAKIDFAYGADGHRVLQEVAAKSGGDTSRTVYVGLGATGKSIYERTTTGSNVEHVQFLYAGGAHGGNAIALRVTTGATESMKYNLFDHLGSVTAMTDDVGQVIGPTADPANSTVFWYDAWGSRRNPDGSRTSTSANLQPGHREYTGHETIPQVGLVNMNGRVYDPDLGRFLSPDPNVQFVANLQSYNRYSYVLNNPLRYTDPTGYFLGELLSEGPFALMNGPGLLTTLGTLLACSAGGPGACLGMMAWSAVVTSTTMAMQGASFGQIEMAMAIQFGASAIGGGIAGDMIGDAGGGFGMGVLGGAISGGVAAAIATPLMTGSVRGLGENILMGAVNGAAMAGVTWAVRNGNAVSVASAGQQGGGGGSGADQVQAAELKVAAGTTADGDSGGSGGGREGGSYKVSIYDRDAKRGAMFAGRIRDELTGPLADRYRIQVVNREATAADVGAMGDHDVMIGVLGKGGASKAMGLFKASGLNFDEAGVSATLASKFGSGGGGVALGRIAIVPVATASPFGADNALLGNIAAHEFGHAISNWGNPALDHATGGLMAPSIGTADGPLHFSPNFLNQFMLYR